MLLTERPEPVRGNKRRRRVLPAPTLATRPFEGAALLDELTGAEGELFDWARDVALWVQTPDDHKRGLFRGGNDCQFTGEGALARAAGVLSGMRSRPQTVRGDAIAEACTGISEWAEGEALTNTAVYFLELASWAAPDDALLALAAGRANRRNALYERARHWFERGIDVARAQEDRPAQAAGHLSWGNMEFQRGRHKFARRYYLRAWKIARRFHLREEGGAARHNMMTLALELGRFDEAQEHALAAYRFYGRKHERMPYFAHDVAQLWSWQGLHTAAVPIFRAVMPLIDRPKERIKVLANLGRAAAGMGDVDTFFEAWIGVATYVPESNEHLAEAYVNIGEAAMLLGLSAQAQDVAARALSLARARGERSTEVQAEALTNAIRAPAPGKRPPREAPDTVKALSSWLLKTLKDQAAPSK